MDGAWRGALALLSGLLMVTSGCVGIAGDDGDLESNALAMDGGPPEKTGETVTIDLYMDMATQEIEPGTSTMVWAFSTSPDGPFEVPGPEIRVTEGDLVRINFHNLHNMAHTIHWHGLHVPWEMDGVPYLTQDPVMGGETFTYEFVAGPAGTHMYHCHVDAKHHVDMGMYGSFIVEPREGEADEKDVPHDSEETVMLDAWDKDHVHNVDGLGNNADPSSTGNPIHTLDTAESQARDVGNDPPNPTADNSTENNNPAQEERDWYPATYPAYEPEYDSYLMNGKAFPLTEPLSIAEGERLKVRLANAGFVDYSLHLHGHSFLVTHKDGIKLDSPYRADTIHVTPGERYDILIDGVNPGVWLFHDHGGGASNDGVFPGGAMTVLVYEQYEDTAGGQFPDDVSGNYVNAHKRT